MFHLCFVNFELYALRRVVNHAVDTPVKRDAAPRSMFDLISREKNALVQRQQG